MEYLIKLQSAEPPMTDQERYEQLLHKKIENVMPIIVKNCLTEKFQEKWRWPKRDMATGLYKDVYCKLYSFN